MSAAFSQQPSAEADLVGSVRSFGEFGPTYEVLAVEDGVSALVRVVESEETLLYPIENVRRDPDA